MVLSLHVQTKSSDPGVFPVYPAYAGRYKIMDLMKLQFSRIAKDARRQFAGLMERPKVVFRETWRFSRSMTNREFRRRWYRNHRGRFIASEHPRYWVYTASPGPGPLVKSALYLRKQADKEAQKAAKDERMKLRAKRTEGPPRPARVDPVLRDSVTLTSKPSKPKVPSAPNAPRKEAPVLHDSMRAMKAHIGSDGVVYQRYLGGLALNGVKFTSPPPVNHWKKYWFFYRNQGFWRISDHHPYGDEAPIITDWLNGNLESPIPND